MMLFTGSLLFGLSTGLIHFQLDGLPATSTLPRDRAAWHAYIDRVERMPNRAERFPSEWPALLERWREIAGDEQVLDAGVAARLTSELWTDWGHPDLNEANQNLLLQYCAAVCQRWPERIQPDARTTLLDGLLRYYEAGGGRNTLDIQCNLATSVRRLAPDVPVVQRIADELSSDTIEWVDKVDPDPSVRESVYRQVASDKGEGFWLDLHERRLDVPLPKERPNEYEKALESLRALLATATNDERALRRRTREATDAALKDCGEAVFNDDLVCRLLITYRCVLERKPQVPANVSEEIEKQLVRLPRNEPVASVPQWQYWVQAVRVLEPKRTSSALKDYVKRIAKSADVPEAPRKEIAKMAERLSADSR